MGGAPYPMYAYQPMWYYRPASAMVSSSAVQPAAAPYANHGLEPAAAQGAAAQEAAGASRSQPTAAPLSAAAGGRQGLLGDLPLRETPPIPRPYPSTAITARDAPPLCVSSMHGAAPSSTTGGASRSTGTTLAVLASMEGIEPASHSAGASEAAGTAWRSAAGAHRRRQPRKAGSRPPIKGGGEGGKRSGGRDERSVGTPAVDERRNRWRGSAEGAAQP